MDRLVVGFFLFEQVDRQTGMTAPHSLQPGAGVGGTDAFALQSPQVIQPIDDCLSQGIVHGQAPRLPISRSQMAALMGRPVSSSIQRYWPAGLISMNT